jgi:hypothetical protein
LYVIDTSALVDLRLEYPHKTFARLWQRFADLANEGRLVAPHEVRHELAQCDDELKAWASRLDRLFRMTDEALLECLARVMQTCPVHGGRYFDADPWIVALALELHEAEAKALFPRPVLIITHEAHQTKPGAPPKIPDVAASHGLRCIRLRDVFNLENWEGH